MLQEGWPHLDCPPQPRAHSHTPLTHATPYSSRLHFRSTYTFNVSGQWMFRGTVGLCAYVC